MLPSQRSCSTGYSVTLDARRMKRHQTDGKRQSGKIPAPPRRFARSEHELHVPASRGPSDGCHLAPGAQTVIRAVNADVEDWQ